MSGLNILMKSFGVDPAEIQKSVEMFGALVLDMKTQLDRIEAKLDTAINQKEEINDIGNAEDGNKAEPAFAGETG